MSETKKARTRKCKAGCEYYREIWNKNGAWFIPYDVTKCEYCIKKDDVLICTKGKKKEDEN